MEAAVLHEIRDTIRLHVHAIDVPVSGVEDAFGQVMADEAIDAEYQDLLHFSSNKR